MKVLFLLPVTLLFFLVSCDQVNLTAPDGSTLLSITAQPPTLAANGIANITVVGTRDNGAPLPDGTVIQFTTNLGSVAPNPAETKDGVARAKFQAGARSGTATITASSGETEAVSVDVVIGDARPVNVFLVATPSTLPSGGGTVQLKAIVTDTEGNPLGGIGVIFETTSGTLQSEGRVIRTNDAGAAFDRLTTELDATVTATTLNAVSDAETTIDVAPGEGPTLCEFVFSPDEPDLDETVFFIDTSTAGDFPIVQFLWNFGDGETDEGQTVEHSYDSDGTFNVVHTIVDSAGNSSICSQTIVVGSTAPSCAFTFEPTEPTNGDTVNFDASESSDDGEIVLFSWDFGDANTATSTDPTISHPYTVTETTTFTVTLTVTDDGDNESTCTADVTVTLPE